MTGRESRRCLALALFFIARVFAWSSASAQPLDLAGLPGGFSASGYLQPQLVVQSPTNGATVIAQPDGTTTNQTFFRLRRARFKLEAEPTDFAHMTFELEPFTKGGASAQYGTIARMVEAMGHGRVGDVAFEFAAGQFNVPFGSEVPEPNALRPFIDSSFAAGAMFPGDFDIGARAAITYARLNVQTSLLNGVSLGESTPAVLPDLNRGKDLTLRVAYDARPIVFGASGYIGSGQLVDPVGLRFKTFRRWAANAEATLDERFVSLGRTKVVLGITYATNMDRGALHLFALPDFPSDLSQAVVDRRELAALVRVEQEVTPRFVLGARWDYYTPDLALADDGRHALSTVAVVRFTNELQLMIEYDVAFDRQHPRATESPNNVVHTGSFVFQVRF